MKRRPYFRLYGLEAEATEPLRRVLKGRQKIDLLVHVEWGTASVHVYVAAVEPPFPRNWDPPLAKGARVFPLEVVGYDNVWVELHDDGTCIARVREWGDDCYPLETYCTRVGIKQIKVAVFDADGDLLDWSAL